MIIFPFLEKILQKFYKNPTFGAFVMMSSMMTSFKHVFIIKEQLCQSFCQLVKAFRFVAKKIEGGPFDPPPLLQASRVNSKNLALQLIAQFIFMNWKKNLLCFAKLPDWRVQKITLQKHYTSAAQPEVFRSFNFRKAERECPFQLLPGALDLAFQIVRGAWRAWYFVLTRPWRSVPEQPVAVFV